MPAPTFDCPVCRTVLSWDIVFAHQGVREAMTALVNADPDGAAMLRPLLSYITLFAPAKTAMRYERIAALADELVAMMHSAQIERDGRVYAAPRAYWKSAFQEVVNRAHAGGIRLPLASHGYLLEVLVGYANKAEAKAETQREQQRAGHAGTGTAPERKQASTSVAELQPAARPTLPPEVRESLLKAANSRRINTINPVTEK